MSDSEREAIVAEGAPDLTPNLGKARAFIEALTGSADTPMTFQTYDDAKLGRALAFVRSGTLARLGSELVRLNARGAGIFVTVNETDLKGRREANVVAIRAVFCDFDAGPPERYALPPFIVQSKRGPQAYWLLVPGTPLEAFRLAQKQLAAFYGSDASIHDLPRVMRLPGFIHRKGEPYFVSFPGGPRMRYTLAQVLEAHPVPAEVLRDAATPIAPTDGGKIPRTKRHDEWKAHAARLRNDGLSPEQIYRLLLTYRDELFEAPEEKTHEEARALAQWFDDADVKNPRIGTAEPEPDVHLTDKGNGIRFSNQHRGLVVWSQARQQFFVFDGRRFVVEGTCQAEALAKRTIETIWDEARAEPDHDRQKVLRNHAMRSESARALTGMLKFARSESGIPIEESDFDRDPWLLNVPNGTVDLRTGKLRKHDPEDRISKLAPVEYDPTATCPIFDACLLRFMRGDAELIEFLWQFMGYCLSGSVEERKAFLIIGPTRTLKSTFVHVMEGILGDYALTAPPELLLSSRWGNSSGPSEDLARLRGARFVSCIESDADRDLSIARVKLLTGTDRITARFLHQNSITFPPTFKVLLATNEPPSVKDPDDATWSRLVRIPFDVQISEDEVNPRFFEDHLAAELPGILAGGVAACMRWQQAGGLVLPQMVRAAVKEYRDEEDAIGLFIESKCVREGRELHGRLYASFCDWFTANYGKKEQPPTSNTFGRRLKTKGFPKGGNGDRFRIGLSLWNER